MKYKLWGALLCVCAIVLSLVAPLFESGVKTRCHQHWDVPAKAENTAAAGVFSTHLPLVEIDTGGVEIPGKAVLNESGRVTGYTAAADGSETITARMNIVDHETTYNHADDTPTLSTGITIHVRGNSSRSFDKSSYSIRLVNEDGSSNSLPVMGMDAHHEWALHGPYLDKTLLRNYMWYNIGGEIMDYAPNVRFCEVILNGAYQGVYVMMEKITAGEDGTRLSLTVNAKRNTFSGYLLQLNGSRPPVSGDMTNQFTYYAKRTPYQLDIVYPGRRSLTPEMKEEISKDFSDFEKALYSYDYDHETYGYANNIDVESFLDYFLINELTCNYDAGWLSTYIYKNTAGKFHMCLWDMNSACDNYQQSQVDGMGFQMQNCLWYVMLMKDEDFTDALIDRYWELRETYFSEDYLYRYIDDTIAYLGDAIDRNYEVWGYTFQPEYNMLTPAERNPGSYEEAVEQMKEFLRKRISWMDRNIDTLRQYSAESKVKKFNENAN